jgi:rhodanese-related sulfurtransferase
MKSSRIHEQLIRLGYQRVFNVAGGMNAWAGAGLPVIR